MATGLEHFLQSTVVHSEGSVPALSCWLKKASNAETDAMNLIRKVSERMAAFANKKRRHCDLHEGDMVLVSTRHLVPEGIEGSRKLMPMYCGPFAITRAVTPVTFQIDLPQPLRERRIHNSFHSSLLKP